MLSRLWHNYQRFLVKKILGGSWEFAVVVFFICLVLPAPIFDFSHHSWWSVPLSLLSWSVPLAIWKTRDKGWLKSADDSPENRIF